MNLFGPDWEGAPVAEDVPFVDAPVGEPCAHCKEPIAAGDSGLVMPHVTSFDMLTPKFNFLPWHRACHLRGVFGCVAHQLHTNWRGGRCDRSCRDDPTLTKRQAAEAAVACFEAHVRSHDTSH